jgi:hypothetical protein
MSLGSIIRSFVSGVFIGGVGAIGLAFYLLTTPPRGGNKDVTRDKSDPKDDTEKETNNKRLSMQNGGLLSEECREMLDRTISLLDQQMNNQQQQQQQYQEQRIQDSVGDDSITTTGASRANLEVEYTDFHDKSKERTRQLKLMAQMCQDMGRAYHIFGKNMSTISSIAKSNVSKKLAEGDPIDEFMRAFLHLAEALSTDSEKVGEILSASAESGVFSHIALISDYLGAKDKLLGNEGSKIILALRDSQQLMEKRGDERDRFREKLSAGGGATGTSAGAGQSSAGGTTLQKVIDMATHIKQQADDELHKLSVQKLQASELALLDHSLSHEETEKEFEKVTTCILKLCLLRPTPPTYPTPHASHSTHTHTHTPHTHPTGDDPDPQAVPKSHRQRRAQDPPTAHHHGGRHQEVLREEHHRHSALPAPRGWGRVGRARGSPQEHSGAHARPAVAHQSHHGVGPPQSHHCLGE